MMPAARSILSIARSSGMPVLHLPECALQNGLSDSAGWRDQRARNGWPEELAHEGTWGHAFVPALAPTVGELVVDRYRPGGLVDTRAPVLLRAGNVRRVVVAGVETHRAILATAIQAVCLDFEVVIARESVGSTDIDRGEAALEVLQSSWAEVVSAKELGLFLGLTPSSIRAAGDFVPETTGEV
jgi:biuret amidohydrolase